MSVPVGGCDKSLDKIQKPITFKHTSNFIVVPLTVVPPSPSPVAPNEFWIEKLFLKCFPVPENKPPVVC